MSPNDKPVVCPQCQKSALARSAESCDDNRWIGTCLTCGGVFWMMGKERWVDMLVTTTEPARPQTWRDRPPLL